MSTVQHALEVTIYLLAALFSVYAAAEIAPLGLTAFTASSLLFCFAGSAWSLFKMISKGPY